MREERKAYPIVISKEEDGFYYVSIPDFDIATQGESIADAMEMARDAIGIMGIDYLDDGKVLPEPNTKEVKSGADDIVTLVDVDFAEYRKKVDNKAVKKNCTIPYWLNVEAEKAGINYSKVLQDAIMRVLGINKGVN
jgi:predicted RNase H-like HicB family nuclease